MGARSEDIGQTLTFLPLINLAEGAAWDGVADVAGASIDRQAYNMPLSCKVYFEIEGTAADTAQLRFEQSVDDTVWTAVNDRDGNAIVIDLVDGTTDRATVDIKLTGTAQYFRGVMEADNSTISTTAELVAIAVFGGAKEQGL